MIAVFQICSCYRPYFMILKHQEGQYCLLLHYDYRGGAMLVDLMPRPVLLRVCLVVVCIAVVCIAVVYIAVVCIAVVYIAVVYMAVAFRIQG